MWNVNRELDVELNSDSDCINRNIVECKYVTTEVEILEEAVLIETLWNVNTYNNMRQGRLIAVLIETLWNVNCKSFKS